MVKILAIETSCDETSAAVVEDGCHICSNIVATQIKSHMRFGGVVPEIASRHHVEMMNPMIQCALDEAGLTMQEVDAIAVTKGPGLVGSLLIGITAAKSLAFAFDKPLIGVNHIAGHVYAARLQTALQFPLLALVVSGGHTELLYLPEDGVFKKMGDTRDDAVGEAYDKIGRVLNLPYPGGKRMDELAALGEDTYHFPRPMLDEQNYDFSFSGLKSAVINDLHKQKQKGIEIKEEDVAASFQAAAVEVLLEKTCRLLDELPAKQLILCGGVAANSALRRQLESRLQTAYPTVQLILPPLSLCGDNAAMIGAYAYTLYQRQEFADLYLDAVPGLDIMDEK